MSSKIPPSDDTAPASASARPYHHGHLRTALIDAGLAALERSDTVDLSLRAIARDVGVSANAAYRHFEDKNALLGALATEGFRRFAALQMQAAQAHEADPIAARTATGLAYIQFAKDHPALFRLMFGAFLPGHGGEELKQIAMSAFLGLLAMAARESGTSADDERALLTAVARWAMVHGLSQLLLDGQLNVFEGRIDDVIRGVLLLDQLPTPSQPAATKVSKNAAKKAAKKAGQQD
jgi:AcrR family transcriptional regulator